ncbi:MAG: HipA domain-containing protein [Campylobacteraceae bacterium]|nr:HipA domain-containing protein [Campylobacteraceae bacterium]
MKIIVYEKGRILGYLTQNDNNNIIFEYNSTVSERNYIPSLEDKISIFEENLPAVFEALLPEDGKIDYIKATNNIKNKIEILLYLDGVHGSFEFIEEGNAKDYIPPTKETIYYERDKVAILDNDYKFPNILDFSLDIDKGILDKYGKHDAKVIGLSGYQNKFGVDIDFSAKSITHNDKAIYFMKPYNEEYTKFDFKRAKTQAYIPFLSINEHLFMTMARDLGFDVPWSAIIKAGQDYHYIIKRYDRYKKGSLDHFDSAVFLNLASSTKYDTTYEKVFDKLNENLSRSQMKKAFKFLVYSIVISHGDFHAKNISIIKSHNVHEEEIV